ncbi:MAG: hypothetical protein SGILL_009517, partial [Bacillariaceae sp.]
KDPTRPDAVIIIPLLKSKNDSTVADTILVEQFRPPVGCATLEFPAGLMDDGETAVEAALRELKEETGYIGEADTATNTTQVVPTVSRNVCMSPGLADETVQVVMVEVDLDKEENKNPQATPDAGEHIKVHRVSLKEGFQTLLDQKAGSLSSSSPMAIQGLYLFAVGLEIGKSMK